MTLSYEYEQEYQSIVATVRSWPAPQRVALMHELLTTLTADNAKKPSTEGATLPQALGLLATTEPPPTDAEIAAMLHERHVEKRYLNG